MKDCYLSLLKNLTSDPIKVFFVFHLKCNILEWMMIPLMINTLSFRGINTNQSVREKDKAGSSGGKREVRQRKSSQQEVNINDDEIVESCKVRIISQQSTHPSYKIQTGSIISVTETLLYLSRRFENKKFIFEQFKLFVDLEFWLFR